MARFTQGGGSGDGSALNFVQNKVAQPVPVTGYPTTIAAVTITTTGKPVQISLTGEGSNAQAGSWVRLNIFRDGQEIGNTIQIEASAISENVPYAINVIDEVGSGQHVYEAIIISMSAGNWSFGEASGPIMNAVELTGFKGDTGAQGSEGPTGQDGQGFNFRGAWVTDTLYLQNDVVTQNGSTYIANYDYQDTSGPYLDGDLWAPIALKGDTGPQGETGPQGPAGEGGESGPKTWTAPNDALYEIRQAHGGIEVTLDQPLSYGENINIVNNVTNSSTITVTTSSELSAIFSSIWTGSAYFRKLSIDFNNQTRYFIVGNPTSNENEWVLEALDGPLTTYSGNSYYVNLEYGGVPVVWWNADNLGFMPEGDEWKFRGAKVEYHSYSTDSGTMIGTIYIASDSGDNYVTHIETNSGASDNGNVVLWKRHGNERELYAYRVDNEDDTVKIHWTAQVYYGTEYYD